MAQQIHFTLRWSLKSNPYFYLSFVLLLSQPYENLTLDLILRYLDRFRIWHWWHVTVSTISTVNFSHLRRVPSGAAWKCDTYLRILDLFSTLTKLVYNLTLSSCLQLQQWLLLICNLSQLEVVFCLFVSRKLVSYFKEKCNNSLRWNSNLFELCWLENERVSGWKGFWFCFFYSK